MLYTDWKKYISDGEAFSHDHFQTLLTDTSASVTPEQAFSLIPKSKEMIARADELVTNTDFSGLYFLPKASSELSPEKLLSLINAYTKQVADYLSDEGFDDEASLLLNAKASFTNDQDAFHAAVIDRSRRVSEAETIIGDDFADASDAQGLRPGVYEATHFMTKNSGVTHYIISGLVSFPIDFKPLFDFYLGGGEVTFYEDEILIYAPGTHATV